MATVYKRGSTVTKHSQRTSDLLGHCTLTHLVVAWCKYEDVRVLLGHCTLTHVVTGARVKTSEVFLLGHCTLTHLVTGARVKTSEFYSVIAH